MIEAIYRNNPFSLALGKAPKNLIKTYEQFDWEENK